MRSIANILSFDVEDWYQVENLKPFVNCCDWDNYEPKVEKNVDLLLSILNERGTKATFFVLGWCAERMPELIKRIADAGHEVGSHGYGHNLIYNMSQNEFEDDIAKSLEAISCVTGKPVLSYRAPSFSIVQDSIWALDILAKLGIKYDSSIFPIKHHRYGMPEAPDQPYIVDTEHGQVVEFPIYTVSKFGKKFPAGGGCYYRLMPYPVIRYCLRQAKDGVPAVLYMHPWEFDASQPRFRMPFLMSIRCYYGFNAMERKLRRLLTDFEFAPLSKVAAEMDNSI